ncbi:pirin family protein [Calidifontibacter sp. DB0510]|uniref:Pirin family protein n=1 Tax=Metallococcus carri TaxID=1656884 RepID=A0A967AZS0_9MICO|nr:pirin family protein [Metallococcus carri]NHN55374.1 pirin family protein [Metallococcus carri]NOP36451.1 pirin family protein [Calidifontibacter sp. DB2511S]
MTDAVQVLAPRTVPLGGIRSLEVRRTLPHKDRSFVGAWCFADHYGPTQVIDAARDGMDVPPHPHTGLQTVSWLFEGAIEHRDSAGVHAFVRPGEMNLMTGGHGIAHSEVSTPDTQRLHGVQLWVALPESDREQLRDFQHHAPQEVSLPGDAGTALVFLGDLAGVGSSPVRTFTPLLGAELRLAAGATLELDVRTDFEHAVLVDSGEVTLEGSPLSRGDLGCVDPGSATLHLSAGDEPARVVLLGGEPFEEEIVMWWNFVGRSHEEIVAAREEYERGSDRFGQVPGYAGAVDRIPAPPIPPIRLRPRNRLGRIGG